MKKIALLGLLALAACGSRSASDPSTNNEDPGTSSGGAEGATEGAVSAVTDARTGAASHVEGRTRPLLRSGVTATDATVAFVAEKRDLFRLAEAARELRASRVERDDLGMTHVRMQQVVGGVPVFGAELTAHYARDGALVTVDATLRPDAAKLDVVPSRTAIEAERAAHADLRAADARFDAAKVEPGLSPELVVYAPEEGAPALAWKIETRGGLDGTPMRMVSFVDAKTGAVLHKYDNIQTVAGAGAGVLGTQKKLDVTQSGGAYQLVDTSRSPAGIRTMTANNTQNIPGTVVTSTSATDWDNAAAVDAHAHAMIVYDYYKTTHARLGIDGANGRMLSNVNFGSAYNNAFWDGQQMTYGDGDGTTFRAFSASLDVVAHELTHGVTERTSGLVYQNQSGAMNEAVSDIFGSFVDHFANPNPATEWVMGENIALGQRGRRDMKDPRIGQQPAHMNQLVRTTQDNGGVHINSGIPNNAAYLMTVGGSNVVSQINVPYGIGFEKAAKIWYRANTNYFQANTDIAGAARGTLSAAKDLGLTQREQDIVECAWIATGVVAGTQCKSIGPETPPATPDAGTASPGGSAGTPGGAGGGEAGTGPVGPDGAPIGGSAGNGSSNGADTGDETSDEGSGGTGTSSRKKSKGAFANGSTAGCQAAPGGVGNADMVALAFGVLAAARGLRRKKA